MRDRHRLEKNSGFVGRRVGTSEDKTLEADALLQRTLAQEALVYAHSLSAQELKQFVPFDLPNAQKERYESLDMARDAIALAAARSIHMREEFVFFNHPGPVCPAPSRFKLPSDFPEMDDYMQYEKGEMSFEVRKGKDPHLFLVNITLMAATNAELANFAPHEVDKSRIESRTVDGSAGCRREDHFLFH
ncbi:hypothetical protein MY11210_000918 [Beauveria gryllotalpidicola]